MPISGYCLDGQWIPRHEDPAVETYRDRKGKFKVTKRRVRLRRCTWCRLWTGNRTRWCAQCKEVSYCSVDCQRGHWRGEHRDDCIPYLLPPTPDSESCPRTPDSEDAFREFMADASAPDFEVEIAVFVAKAD